MVFNATLKKNQFYRGSQFYWWRNPEYPEKTTDMPQVTDKLYIYNLFKSFKHKLSNSDVLTDTLIYWNLKYRIWPSDVNIIFPLQRFFILHKVLILDIK
jgi:hypothetical protein